MWGVIEYSWGKKKDRREIESLNHWEWKESEDFAIVVGE
jgi:hypothetical protein